MVAGTQVSLGSRNVARRGHWGHVWGQRREVQVVRVSAAPITHNNVSETTQVSTKASDPQPMRGSDQSMKGSDQPMRGSNQPMRCSDQPMRGSDQPMRGGRTQVSTQASDPHSDVCCSLGPDPGDVWA